METREDKINKGKACLIFAIWLHNKKGNAKAIKSQIEKMKEEMPKGVYKHLLNCLKEYEELEK